MSNQKNEIMDASAVYTMFEEIKENQTEQLTAIEKMFSTFIPASTASVPTLTSGDSEKIETLNEKLNIVSEQLNRPLKHHHTIDFMGNWAIIALMLAVGAFISSLWVINHQRQTLAGFRDNDLKYRYIQMHGKATPTDIERLRNVFDWNRNPDSIRTIRHRVERYEKLVQKQAENEAQARLNDEQAKQLKQEAETLKGRK
jgi:hypothetical protein